MKSKVLTFDYVNYTYIIKYKHKDYVCHLDEEDFYRFKGFNWVYRRGYLGRSRRVCDPEGSHWIHLHQEVIKSTGVTIPSKHVVDHINRDKMDNRRINLRVVTSSENSINVSEETNHKRRLNVSKATEAASRLPRTKFQIACSLKSVVKMNASRKNIHIGADNYASKKIINTLTEQVFDSIKEASTFSGYNYSTLRSQINGTNPNTSPFIYFKDFKP
jgi:hypothetical protein